ncbi:unnamed protein product [Polarella glacialis]|uniref:C2H2-type domain-containing protein n=1 Tax=Polarella glacialis TaxID=89957 RepID=A0A813JED5_POLGL|nr:unnamed protein product [Polarella glacialis]
MARLGGGLPPCGFLVSSEKAGQLPIATERRALGKKVTVVSGVRGNARALCTALTTLLGVGGSVHPKGPLHYSVEVQGEQVDRVSQALLTLGCIRGPGGAKPAPVVVERDCAYDDFLRREVASDRPDRKPRASAKAELPEPPEDAPCRAWHGRWMYCVGHCTKVMDRKGQDVWYDSLGQDADMFVAKSFGSTGATAARNGSTAFESALQKLGMSAEVGKAVESFRQEIEQEVARRAAPQPSLCAPLPRGAAHGSDKELRCEECGAVFNMKKTLQLHIAQHARDRDELRKAWAETPSAPTDVASWRRGSAGDQQREEFDYTSTAVPASVYWPDEEDISDKEAAQYLAPRSRAPVVSFMDLAVKQKVGKRRGQDKAVDCPVCNQSFLASEIEGHVEYCLTVQGSLQQELPTEEPGEELPTELLESLLDLQLPAEAADRFWSSFERLSARMSVQDAFLAALESSLWEENLTQLPHEQYGGSSGSHSAVVEQTDDWTTVPSKKGSVASNDPHSVQATRTFAPEERKPHSQSEPACQQEEQQQQLSSHGSSEEYVACPVCGESCPVGSLVEHVERCLDAPGSGTDIGHKQEEEATAATLPLEESTRKLEQKALVAPTREAASVSRWSRSSGKKAEELYVKELEKVDPLESIQERMARMKAEARARKASASKAVK